MRTTLGNLLETQTVIIADGGMGTMLFALGLQRGSAPELWNVERPDEVQSVHRGYITAGAQIILTNTFGGNRPRLEAHGLAGRVRELNCEGARLANAEAERTQQPVVVAGSVGPIGQMLAPLGDLEYADAVKLFAEQAAALSEGGVGVLWIETMSDLEEVHAAVEGCQRAAPHIPRVTTMTFDTHGRTMMGVKPQQAARTLRGYDVLALGANCGNGPDELEAVIEQMHEAEPDAVLVAKANAGLPHMVGEMAVYDATPALMAEYALRVHECGARIIGACCGSTPDHVFAIAGALNRKDTV
jgi:5-methyltetrahydrofolate--homocysteine methyltransferase